MWAGCTSGARPARRRPWTLVGLARRSGVRVKQLSGGEKRRLDLALALLGRPEVLFLDEPTTGLDAEGRRSTWELVRELRDGGTTVLLTTHYLEEAEELADRLAILHEGRHRRHRHPGRGDRLPAVPDLLRTARRLLPRRPARRSPRSASPGTRRRAAPSGCAPHELQRAATGLLLWAERTRVELRGLDVRSASLEEAFLRIAREEAAASEAHGRRRSASGRGDGGVSAVAVTGTKTAGATTTAVGRMARPRTRRTHAAGAHEGDALRRPVRAAGAAVQPPLDGRPDGSEGRRALGRLGHPALLRSASRSSSPSTARWSSVYAARREELVLKRLRTGELRDAEILAGAALPVGRDRRSCSAWS